MIPWERGGLVPTITQIDMKKLYIHAGNHKTGTTAIQNALFQNYDDFVLRGITPVCVDGYGRAAATNFTWAFDQRHIVEGANVRGILYDILANACSFDDASYVISSECFSWIFSEDNLRSLQAELYKIFDEVEILFFVRRQDRHAISHYQQGLRTAVDRQFFSEGESQKSLPYLSKHLIKYLDYNSRIGAWGRVFGDSKITIVPYEDVASDGGLIDSFLKFLGVDCFEVKMSRSNVSWGWYETKLARMLVDRNISVGDLDLQLIDAKVNYKFLPSRQEAAEFYEFFKGSNFELNNRFNINERDTVFDESFDEYEFQTDEWDETSASLVINHLLNLLVEAKLRAGTK